MSDESQFSFLIDSQGDDYQLIQKVIATLHELDIYEFNINDLVSSDLFTKPEKERLKKIFHNKLLFLYACNKQFYYEHGKWKYEKYKYTMKQLLMLLNNRKFKLGATANTTDLTLIKNLLLEWDEMFVREWEMSRYDEAPRFEIDEEILHYISDHMKKQIGECNTFDFNFVKTFTEAYYDYNGIILERIILSN
ncbi:MAG: hypothetical protein AB2L12_14490 [Smithellaceae bacterium]